MQHREPLFRIDVLRRNAFVSSVLTCDLRWALINEIQLNKLLTAKHPRTYLQFALSTAVWMHFLVLQVALQVSI